MLSQTLHGPGSPYTVLFDAAPCVGLGLPAPFHAIYGDWFLSPPPATRPLLWTNFVVSHDGRTSFDLPGRRSGGEVSGYAAHDGWLMALLRTRADAILTGAATLRTAIRHFWSAEELFPADAAAFTALRAAEGRTRFPLLVILSQQGDLPVNARAFNQTEQQVLIVTTPVGVVRAQQLLGDRPMLRYVVNDTMTPDLATLVTLLRSSYGVNTLLSEGGPHIYGQLFAQRLLDDIFITRSPIVIGNPPAPARPRPSLIEGTAFNPDNPPRIRLLSLRRAGDYLFERSVIFDEGVRG